ncbi:MAG TPA: M42 family metallopeptidase [Pirellulales bacterium]|nr:M42 family metallopeptidase [Pirellulales bacterium]
MDSQAFDFLKLLLETPSPSGYEQRIQAVVRTYVSEFADDVRGDVHGNLIAVRNPSAKLRVMLAGHCDQIGFVVQHIDSEGFLWIQPVGGWDPQVLVGQKLTVWPEGEPVNGVVARKPIHLLTDEERKVVPKLKDLWLDIGAKDREQAASLVAVGDPVTLELGYRQMLGKRASAPGMDDKTGLWVAIEALRRTKGKRLNCAFYAVSTVQEEIGLRGAMTSTHSIEPHVGIAIDVTHATDCPTIDKKQEGDVALGKGPVIYRGPNMNPRVVTRLIEAAKEKEIPHQMAANGRATGTDANTIQISRGGVAAALISLPNRYMHSPVEVVSLDDLDHAADLLAEFALGLAGDEDFRP